MINDSSFKLRQAVHELNKGSVIAYPTEAVYGLGCNPLNGQAVLNLLHIKQRPLHKGLILIAANLKQLESYVQLNDDILAKITPHLHEPITWLIPAKDSTPHWLTGEHDSLAVRVTQHPVAKALCTAYGGAIVSTSANINKQPAIKSKSKLIKTFAKQPVFILHGNVGNLQRETAIYDALTNKRLR